MRTTQFRGTRRAIAAAAIAPLLALGAAGAARADSAPLRWSFDKCPVSATDWTGTATGPGGTVSLRTHLTDFQQSGISPILRVTFDWAVGDVFVASLRGTLNMDSGAVVMNGIVATGQYAGSRVHEEGQRYLGGGCFAGTIQVLPAS